MLCSVLARLPEFQSEEGEFIVSAISKNSNCNVGIELAESRLSVIRRIRAVRNYYGTKNAVETVTQLQFECEAKSGLQLSSHSFDGIFSAIINSDGLTTFVYTKASPRQLNSSVAIIKVFCFFCLKLIKSCQDKKCPKMNTIAPNLTKLCTDLSQTIDYNC